MRFSRCLYHGVQGWGTLGEFAVFSDVNVVERPCVFEGGTGGLAADGGGIVAVGIEGRIEIDQVDTTAIHSPHNM